MHANVLGQRNGKLVDRIEYAMKDEPDKTLLLVGRFGHPGLGQDSSSCQRLVAELALGARARMRIPFMSTLLMRLASEAIFDRLAPVPRAPR